MVTGIYSKDEVMDILSAIPDPEIPVVNIREMGMLRDVEISAGGCNVFLMPTYTACPAMHFIECEIVALLERNGLTPAKVTRVIEPVWSTDWMTAEAKEKLRRYGIAPPLRSVVNREQAAENVVCCPRCDSDDTVLISTFGATACKALFKCNHCKEPFEYFKCH
jgi:ring-1,2-phenylacetyl-CoA epoxidase subunit PaaD